MSDIETDVVDKSEVENSSDLSLIDYAYATEDMSGGQTLEASASALSSNLATDLSSPDAAADPDIATDYEFIGAGFEPDPTPGLDLVLEVPDYLPPHCPDDDDLADAVPEEYFGCDPEDAPMQWDAHAADEAFAVARDEAISELEDIIGDWIMVDPIYLINSVVDGFTGARSRPSAYTAVDVLRDTFKGRGEEAREPWGEVQRILRELLIRRTNSHAKGREAVEALSAALVDEQKRQVRKRAAEQSKEVENG